MQHTVYDLAKNELKHKVYAIPQLITAPKPVFLKEMNGSTRGAENFFKSI